MEGVCACGGGRGVEGGMWWDWVEGVPSPAQPSPRRTSLCPTRHLPCEESRLLLRCPLAWQRMSGSRLLVGTRQGEGGWEVAGGAKRDGYLALTAHHSLLTTHNLLLTT